MRDEVVISGIRSRNEAVIQDVITNYSRLLWPIVSAVLHKVGSEQDVEECVADTFIYLWQYPEKFDPEKGKLKSWLCIIARSKAIDRYRQLSRHADVSLEEAAVYVLDTPQDALLWEDTKAELQQAIQTLSEQEQQILIRRYYYRQKPSQIALALDIPLKQVNNQLYRAKRKLRDVLSK